MKCAIAYKFQDENGKDKYLQFGGDFDDKDKASKYIEDYVKDGKFVILGKNTQ